MTVQKGDAGVEYKVVVAAYLVPPVMRMEFYGDFPLAVYDVNNVVTHYETVPLPSWDAAADLVVRHRLGEWESDSKYRLVLNDGVEIKAVR